MRKTIISLLFSLTIILTGCNSWKKTLCSKGDWEALVRNCITDFIHTKLATADSVFWVVSLDDSYRKLDCRSILIGSADYKECAYPSDTVGCYDTFLPTRFIIVDNKLFYWHDRTTPITKELLDVLAQYNWIDRDWIYEELEMTPEELTPDFDVRKYVPFPPMGGDCSAKGAWYYIDKNDYTKYKRYIQSYDPFFEDKSEWLEYQHLRKS